MPAKIIDGRAIAEAVRQEVAQGVVALKARGITPGLGFILVGNDPASRSYVRMKGKACAEAGFHSVTQTLPESASQAELLSWELAA